MISKIIVGNSLPLVGIASPDNVDSSALVDAVLVGVGVCVNVPEAVASPNTCVPLLRISKVCVYATVFPVASTVVIVTLCLPFWSVFGGVKLHVPSDLTCVEPLIG